MNPSKSPSSSKTTRKKTPKASQPKPLQVIYPSPSGDVPPSSSQEPHKSTTPKTAMHAGTKRSHSTTKGNSSSKPMKRIKQADPDSAEEVAKEMSVGFGLNKYCYEIHPFLNYMLFYKIKGGKP